MNWIAIAILLPMFGQSARPGWETAAGSTMKFDVASLKIASGGFRPPNFPLDAGDAYVNTGGRFLARFPLSAYIGFAYKLILTEEQRASMLADLPKWVSTEVFDIEAKAPTATPTKDQMRLMMQALLAERFHLQMHFEAREVPVYELALAKPGKLGPKLHPHGQGPSCDTAPPADFFPGRCNLMGMLPRPNGARIGGARDVTMTYLAEALPSLNGLGRPVIDKTGLNGTFDFTFEWTQDTNNGLTSDTKPATLTESPGFEEALREQLGLRLKASKAEVQVPVIDHIEHPSEN